MIAIIKNKNNRICGTLTFYINLNEATITYLNIDIKYRKMGLGTALLWNLYKYIKNNYPSVENIFFDDCSDNYKKTNNIYRNVGARYLYINGPEMIWKIQSRTVIIKNRKYKALEDYNIFYNI